MRLFLVVADLEHHELVGVEGYRTLRAGETNADEIDARLLPGFEEFALRPVPHDLHSGLALYHHRGGEIPVAPGKIVIDIGAKLGHPVECIFHFIGSKRGWIEIDECRLVEIRPQG